MTPTPALPKGGGIVTFSIICILYKSEDSEDSEFSDFSDDSTLKQNSTLHTQTHLSTCFDILSTCGTMK